MLPKGSSILYDDRRQSPTLQRCKGQAMLFRPKQACGPSALLHLVARWETKRTSLRSLWAVSAVGQCYSRFEELV